MASTAAGRAITEEEVLKQLRSAAEKGGLANFHFVALSPDGDLQWRSVVFVAKTRTGGLMFICPAAAEVEEFFVLDETFAVHPCTVQLESSKGKALGDGSGYLIDAPWEVLTYFRRPLYLRGDPLKLLIRFTFEGNTCRPSRTSVLEAADTWITELMDEDTAQEYVTCEEFGAEVTTEAEMTTAQLLDRITELEGQLSRAASLGRTGAVSKASAPAAPGSLLGAATLGAGAVDSSTLAKLKQLAGSGPTKMAQHERLDRRQAATPEEGGPSETLLQEHALEAVAEEEVEGGMGLDAQMFADPMQKMLYLQMQQLSMMQKQMQSRQPADALQAALSSGPDSNSSSTGGIKGCLAREAFLKISDNLHQISAVVEANALQELGLQERHMTPGLLREYLEKRVPLGTYRLLTQVGYLMAHAYEIGARTGNVELKGFGAKGMVYVEQTALDEGRTGLSWLLTGLPEPNYGQVQQTRAKTSIKPFSRLSAASWIAANVGYLRDLDFLEGRIKNVEKEGGKSAKEREYEAAPNPKAKWSARKRRGKQDGASGGGEESGAS